MEVIDEILEYLATALGIQPDKLKSLEKQAIALMAVGMTNRFAPRVFPWFITNRGSRWVGRYAANHPVAAFFAAWFASDRNANIRPQWAGRYTQEVEFALALPVFANIQKIAPPVWRLFRPLFNPAILPHPAQAVPEAGLAVRPNLLNRILDTRSVQLVRGKIYDWTPKLLNNPVTRGILGYLFRHPAATLASWFTSGYIDETYRPQFFGRYTRELITAGMVPAFAHAPQAAPPIIRGAGSTVYYGSRGLASVTDWLTRSVPAVSATPSVPLLDRILFRSISQLAPWHQEAILGWYRNWVGTQRVQQLYVAHGLLHSGEGYTVTTALRKAAELMHQSEREFASFSGRIGYHWWSIRNYPRIWTRLHWPSPGVQRAILGAGVGGSIAIAGWWVLARVGYRTATGGDGPYWYEYPFLVPFVGEIVGASIAGGRPAAAAVLRHASEKFLSAASLLRPGISFARNQIQSVSSLLRLPQAASLLARARPWLTAEIQGLRRALGLLRSRTVGIASFAPLPVEMVGGIMEENLDREMYLYQLDRVLNAMEILEREGYQFHVPVADTRRRMRRGLASAGTEGPDGGQARSLGEERNFVLRNLFLLRHGEAYARQEIQLERIVSAAQSTLAATELSLTALDQIVENVGQLGQRFQGASFAVSAAQRTRPTPQRRDWHGRWFREQVPYVSPLPDIGLSFDQALAYINRRAAAAARIMTASATTGIPPAPVIPGGVLGEPPAGKGREFWLYRGRDRNLILQSLRDMQTIVRRDQLAEDDKKTLKISTRERIFRPEVPGLPGAVIRVIEALKMAASLVRDRGTQGGYYILHEAD